MTASVCVVGSINRDIVIRAKRLPSPGETVVGSDVQEYVGGKGTNQAIAAARLGATVEMIGRGLNDAARDAFDGSGVGYEAVEEGETGAAYITIDEANGENTIVIVAGANAAVDAACVQQHRGVIEASDVLVVQHEIDPAGTADAVAIASDAGVGVIYNAAPASPITPDVLKRIDLLVVNEHEVRIASGRTDGSVTDAATDLVHRGVSACVVTLGPDGCVHTNANGSARIPTFPIDHLVDTVGAGDAFVGALASAWHAWCAGGDAADDVLRFANAAGALATTREGAVPSLPWRAEVIELLRSADA